MKIQVNVKAMRALEDYIILMMEGCGMQRLVFDKDHSINYLADVTEVTIEVVDGTDGVRVYDKKRLVFKRSNGLDFVIDTHPKYWYWLKMVEGAVEDFIKSL